MCADFVHKLARWAPAGQCEVCRLFATKRVCSRCVTRFAPLASRCRRCAAQVPASSATCGSCLRSPPVFVRAVAAVDYAFPWDRLIIDLKFHGRVELARPLAERLAAAVRAAAAANEIDIVLPVPLAPRRLAERGFNQAWEVARRVATALDRPSRPGCLRRPVDSAHQADLPRAQRAVNLHGAFHVEAADRPALHAQRVALVDDVLTTGATAREASIALLRAGAASVQIWTVARTA